MRAPHSANTFQLAPKSSPNLFFISCCIVFLLTLLILNPILVLSADVHSPDFESFNPYPGLQHRFDRGPSQPKKPISNTMAAISHLIAARSEYAMAQLAKRDNWAQREPGVIVVLVIVFLVLCLLIGLFISKRKNANRA
ncbi:hypothetical protein B5807_01541 [Epicoccum nigrum]|uniref:Uncharacterized protein n=1 Tax=Epicoccum nigrum TaxID=105696 RepID=A0A1Y2MBZ9_EPING|nr:hypothetical protein B5807_01541 [Epicoccum nigrum]